MLNSFLRAKGGPGSGSTDWLTANCERSRCGDLRSSVWRCLRIDGVSSGKGSTEEVLVAMCGGSPRSRAGVGWSTNQGTAPVIFGVAADVKYRALSILVADRKL